MIEIKYDYNDVPTIKSFALDPKFIRGLMGPFASGKSSGCVMELMRIGNQQKPGSDGIKRTRFAAIRNTYQQLKDTTIRTVKDWLPPQYFGVFKEQDHSYLITGFKGQEVEILFRALDRPDQVSNLLSLELTGAWLNEAREIPKAVFDAVQGRVGRFPSVREGGCTRPSIIMDTNPPDSDHWWYKVFEESLHTSGETCYCGQPAYRVFNKGMIGQHAVCKEHDTLILYKQPGGRSKKAENRKNLGKDYYEKLMVGKDPEFIKVYIDGEYGFVSDGKSVYPEYSDTVHCQEIQPLPTIIYAGLDFGLTPACVFTQIDSFGRWLLIDEYCSEDMGIDRFSDNLLLYIARTYPKHSFEWFGDPAGTERAQTDEKTCYQILSSKGIIVTPSEQDLTIRIESVKKPMNSMVAGKPGMLLSPKCRMLRKGFQGKYQYRRLQLSNDKYTEKPDKNEYSHPHDALQYVAVRLFSSSLRIQKEREKRERYGYRERRSWKTA